MAQSPMRPEDPGDATERWLRALRGEAAPDRGASEEAADYREGAALRRHFLAEAEREQGAPDPEAEQRLQTLLFALRRERILEPGRRKYYVPLAIAASVFVAFIVMRGTLEEIPGTVFDEPPTIRGELKEVRISVADPRAHAEATAKALAALGVTTHVYQTGATFFVDAVVPESPAEAAVEALRKLGAQPVAGLVRIRIEGR